MVREKQTSLEQCAYILTECGGARFDVIVTFEGEHYFFFNLSKCCPILQAQTSSDLVSVNI
jgi:hypothetical protein